MNERDSEAVASMLRARGYSIVDSEDSADIILLNTCSVRDLAEQKAIGKAGSLNKQKRKGRELVVGIMGCMAQNRGAQLLDSLPDLDLIVGTQKFHRVPDYLDSIISSLRGQGPRPSTCVDVAEEIGSQNTIRTHEQIDKPTAFVSIMQGCNMNCAFCIVPNTRGAERARPIAAIIEEIEELAQNGTREVTLLGQIVNRYGRTELPFVGTKSPFVQLLEAVQNVQGIERIRFTSPHPCGFKSDLVDCYDGRMPKLCEYIHLPVQSGSDIMLRAMNRAYTIDQYRRLVDKLRKACPSIILSTDIIVGFPGETDADFAQTVDLFKEIGFEMAYIFKYSPRPGTAAEALRDPISKEIKEERNQVLINLLSKRSMEYHQSLVGQTMEILVEEPARKGENIFCGRTRAYRKVFFPGHPRLIGQLLNVKITSAAESALNGELVLRD
jgi:tRNA-2-methylthio-N6-dimethylallyladenosine synthase